MMILRCIQSVPAYDDELLQTGHGSIINEVSNQLGSKPDAIFCSVGGAGLLGGVLKGCESAGWGDGEREPSRNCVM